MYDPFQSSPQPLEVEPGQKVDIHHHHTTTIPTASALEVLASRLTGLGIVTLGMVGVAIALTSDLDPDSRSVLALVFGVIGLASGARVAKSPPRIVVTGCDDDFGHDDRDDDDETCIDEDEARERRQVLKMLKNAALTSQEATDLLQEISVRYSRPA